MPELPEVETVRQILLPKLVNQTINEVVVYYDKILQNKQEILAYLPGKTILNILRYGKFLVFEFEDKVLVSHLRMEGKYFIKDNSKEALKHEHIIFKFNDFDLRYHDTRKFGTMELLDKDNYLDVKPLVNVGSEPKDIDFNEFYLKVSKSRRPIKSILLDQSIIAGLGNIYVDETLFRSNINPLRLGVDITKVEAKSLINSAVAVLDKAVALGGTTIRSYTSSLGVSGKFQNELAVHTKEGESCPVCGTKVIKLKVGGRGTYVCPQCQK